MAELCTEGEDSLISGVELADATAVGELDGAALSEAVFTLEFFATTIKANKMIPAITAITTRLDAGAFFDSVAALSTRVADSSAKEITEGEVGSAAREVWAEVTGTGGISMSSEILMTEGAAGFAGAIFFTVAFFAGDFLAAFFAGAALLARAPFFTAGLVAATFFTGAFFDDSFLAEAASLAGAAFLAGAVFLAGAAFFDAAFLAGAVFFAGAAGFIGAAFFAAGFFAATFFTGAAFLAVFFLASAI